ncbi:MAG: hypothetical protein AB3N23_14440 [Paracoccaceae bacterium]
MTRLVRATMLFLGLAVVAACDPAGGVSEEQRAYHKANRDAYLYQGR